MFFKIIGQSKLYCYLINALSPTKPYLFRFRQSQGRSASPFAQTPALLAIAYA
jgi:hypothetical protein